MYKICDSHSHYIPTEIAENTMFFKVHWSDIDKQLEMMDQFGIEKSLLLYPTSDAHLNMGGGKNVCYVYNEKISQIVKKYDSRFVGAGILPLDSPADVLDEIQHMEALGLKVISLPSSYEGRFLDDEIFIPVFEYAQKKHVLLHVHPQIIQPIGESCVKDPLLTPVLEYMFDVSMSIGKLMMEGVFQKYSNVKFIFAHYGGVLPFIKERFDNTYKMLSKRKFVKDLGQLPSDYFKSLYFDVSGSKSVASLLCALEVTDSSHILFGSDFPANQNIRQSIEMIDQAPLNDIQKKNIYGNNLFKLLDEFFSA